MIVLEDENKISIFKDGDLLYYTEKGIEAYTITEDKYIVRESDFISLISNREIFQLKDYTNFTIDYKNKVIILFSNLKVSLVAIMDMKFNLITRLYRVDNKYLFTKNVISMWLPFSKRIDVYYVDNKVIKGKTKNKFFSFKFSDRKFCEIQEIEKTFTLKESV